MVSQGAMWVPDSHILHAGAAPRNPTVIFIYSMNRDDTSHMPFNNKNTIDLTEFDIIYQLEVTTKRPGPTLPIASSRQHVPRTLDAARWKGLLRTYSNIKHSKTLTEHATYSHKE